MVIDSISRAKTITFLLFVCAFIFAKDPLLKAQNNGGEAYGEYVKTAGSKAVLYRGRLPEKYLYTFNGTPFWESKTFQEGEVKYNGKLYRDVLLNIDACRMELLCRYSYDVSPIVLNRQDVQYARLGGRLFINLNNIGYKDAPEGYFEVIKDGEAPVLRQIKKVYRTDAHDHNGADIGYIDSNYKENIANYFRQEEKFYTLKEGAVKRISKRTAVKLTATPSFPYLETKAEKFEGTNASPAYVKIVKRTKPKGLGLPDGYFDQKADTTGKENENASVTATYRNKVYVIGDGDGKGRVTVTGTVTEMETGLPLPGTVIFDDNTATYERSRKDGSFKITLPGGENRINFKADGKEEIALRVKLLSDGDLNVSLPDRIEVLEAAVVSAESMENHRSAAMGIENISIRTMSKIPSAFGEGDLIKAVLTLPGVKTVGEASGGFNVRGGSQDQNLILFNGNTIYNPTHLFGIFSAFNPDVTESAELYKSVIPAEYGGRISSVLSVKSKDGNRERLKGSAGIGPLTSRIQLDGPIGKKTSFNVAARTSYSDWILKRLPSNSSYSGGTANFADGNAGITHRFNASSTLRLNAYLSHDAFSFSPDTAYKYTSVSASASYEFKGADGRAFSVSSGYDRYSNRTSISSWSSGAFNLDTYIRQVFLRSKAAFKKENHSVSYGLDAVAYGLIPGILTPSGGESAIRTTALDTEYAIEPAAFIQDVWALSEQFSVEGGLRLSGYSSFMDGKFYAGPEFRLSGRYSPAANLSFKGGINTMRQYIHLISNSAGVSPMDTWKLSDGNIAPTTGWQAAGGAYWTLLGSGVDLSAELYYKRSKNALDFKPGAVLSMNPNLYKELIPVQGKSYGIEIMAKKTTGKLTGWASYSYSKAQYKEIGDRGYEAIAAGKWYNTPFDKPHEAKLSANYALTHRYSVSVNADYSTGRPVTVPVGAYFTKNMVHFAYSDRNGYRLPDYFRLDAAINIDPGHYKKALFHTTFTVGVYNITGRKNAYSAFFKTDERGVMQGYMMSVFATQVPYANINLLF